jgi:hypothetical protein
VASLYEVVILTYAQLIYYIGEYTIDHDDALCSLYDHQPIEDTTRAWLYL